MRSFRASEGFGIYRSPLQVFWSRAGVSICACGRFCGSLGSWGSKKSTKAVSAHIPTRGRESTV